MLIACGYDRLETIAKMNVNESQVGQPNDIDMMLSYLKQTYPDDSRSVTMHMHDQFYNLTSPHGFCRFFREEWSSSVLDIPPGHRILLSTFVKDTRNDLTQKSKPPKSQALKIKGRCVPAVKISKYNSLSSSNSNTEIEHAAEDLVLAGATSRIRYQIVKWQDSQGNIQLRQLREHKDYVVILEASSKQGIGFTAKIGCKMCDTRIHLNIDQSNTIKLSNWIHHVKLCVKGKKTKSKLKNQVALTDYFSTSSSSPLSTPDLQTPASGSQTPESPVLDLEQPTSGLQPRTSGLQPDLQLPTLDLQPLTLESAQPDLQPVMSGLQTPTPAAGLTTHTSGLKTVADSLQTHSDVAYQLNNCGQGFQLAPPIVKK